MKRKTGVIAEAMLISGGTWRIAAAFTASVVEGCFDLGSPEPTGALNVKMNRLKAILAETREELGIIQQALIEHTPYEDVAIIADDTMIRDLTREMVAQVEEATLNSPAPVVTYRDVPPPRISVSPDWSEGLVSRQKKITIVGQHPERVMRLVRAAVLRRE